MTSQARSVAVFAAAVVVPAVAIFFVATTLHYLATLIPTLAVVLSLAVWPLSLAPGFVILARHFRGSTPLVTLIYLPVMIVVLFFCGLFLSQALWGDSL
jgi:hypothetical protein